MYILGINYYFHDSTACIVHDGKLIAAIEEERLSRDKHTRSFPRKAIARCLQMAGIDYKDIHHIAVSIKPTHNWDKKVVYALNHLKSFKPFFKHEFIHGYNKQQGLWNWYRHYYEDTVKGPKVHFIPHHYCHAPASFFISPYEEAALMSLDGSGEWATTWLGHGKGNKVTKLGESFFPHSMGSFYEAVTQFCGFRTNYDEGKTMGLAPMGDPAPFKEKVKEILKVDSEGNLKIDLSYFLYQHMGWRRCSQKFFDTFGAPREMNGPFESHHMNTAAAFQEVLEDRALEIAQILYHKTKADYLVISGGVSLNSVMNGRIVRESSFKDVFVIPAAGDNGTAIGAAYYLYNGILGKERNYVLDDPYLGTFYTNEEIKKVLDGAKLTYEYHEDIIEAASELLVEGKIIGWFQHAMEIGPRALGSRSILANPAFPNMKDKINAEVKFREAYRPFAPSVITDAVKDFFEIEVEAPFMLKVCDVKPEKKAIIPAVTHVDGSARVQTVNRKTHERYYDLIKTMGDKTGVPVVLNTSFNIQGEPLVESPKDAVRCFYSTGLDALVIGNYVLRK
ncbi:carbamoyltransferase [Flavobacteriaceae bacterium M23B6Z8]